MAGRLVDDASLTLNQDHNEAWVEQKFDAVELQDGFSHTLELCVEP